MRKTALLVPALAAACSSVPAEPPLRGDPSRTCTVGDIASFVGQPATSENGAAILAATNAAVLRWSSPGMLMTMEYRADRVTVYLDSGNRITRVRCG